MNILKRNLWRHSAGTGAILLLAASVLALRAQGAASSSNSSASLSEDVQGLSREVAQLRLEVETLRASNEALQKQLVTQRDIKALIQDAIAANRTEARNAIAQANTASRKEIVDEVSKQIEALTNATNAQLNKLAKLIGSTSAPVTSGGTTPAPKFDDNFPKTGINYTVLRGDTVSKIARQNNSTEAYILAANHLNDAKDLREGQKIFIPQKPAPEAPTLPPVSAKK